MATERPQPPLRLQQLLERAAQDPELLQRLGADPFGVARAEGIDIKSDHLKALLGMPQATDEELIEVLRSRVSHAATSGVSCIS